MQTLRGHACAWEQLHLSRAFLLVDMQVHVTLLSHKQLPTDLYEPLSCL